VLLLDDGFQHLRLDRQVDIVLIDALDPFRGRDVFPAGRLREPMDQLRRADIFIITRSSYSPLVPAIEAELRLRNPQAPIFHSRVIPAEWIDFQTGVRQEQPPSNRAGAFCGLGNPQSFWRTLHALGIDTVEQLEYGDHHMYRPRELRNMAQSFHLQGADIVLTTEKDAMNLCQECPDLLAPLRLYWLKIEAKLDREVELLQEIEQRLGPVSRLRTP
jgi:tetraacyldisaccharide 4'-kinase